ncbi:GspH/FimT family pseudopilin [Verminephrobacter eiseniae]|uniref:GspH/FimT family pseudopilin n=1 Tax=Verminephrobacter eiseniae TaxID=364317 RepID=UPI002237BF0C|nr:GspH/FimT family pseudopilin [Verminephrobacter eiseniae]
MKRHTGKGRDHGFTLIELMVTIALVAVMMTLAAPSFVQYLRNSELTSLTNTLLAAINAAKSEAMKSGKSAFVQPLGTGWASGWVVYVNREKQSAPGMATIVQKQEPVKSYFSIAGNGTAGESSPYIRFDSSGYSVTTGGAPAALTLTIKRTDTDSAAEIRHIIVARTGRVRTCKPKLSANNSNSNNKNNVVDAGPDC